MSARLKYRINWNTGERRTKGRKGIKTKEILVVAVGNVGAYTVKMNVAHS